MDNKEQLVSLLNKYLANEHTDAELVELLQYFGLKTEAPFLRARILEILQQPAEPSENEAFFEAMAKRVENNLFPLVRKKTRPWRLFTYLSAAILLIGMCIAGYFYQAERHDAGTLSKVEDVAPGTNRAVLTLANGRKINLDTEKGGVVIHAHKLVYKDGTAVAADVNTTGDANPSASVGKGFNTVSTPKGGQYEVLLPDGTKVWLNAQTTLTYPSGFSETSREVEIAGEAYFEVASAIHPEGTRRPSPRPFIVKSRGQEIVVLGTSFNISCYEDEDNNSTTLAEGAVRISVPHTAVSVPLLPGEQALVSASGIKKQKVDVESVISWKNGYFSFNKSNVRSIMRQLSRWYDVEVEYKGKTIPNKQITGDIQRRVKLSEALEMLNYFNVKCHMEGKKIVVDN